MKSLSIESTVTLNNGVEMPWLGFGVFKVKEGDEVVNAVKAALDTGYRSIDTASYYENEQGVGQAMKESGVPRESIFLTTKVWNDQQGYDETLRAFEESRKKLNVNYLDLYLIHWPVTGKFKETWRAFERLYEEGSIRAIGVSNFHIHHLEELLKDVQVKPAVNQVEYHPLLTQKELHQYCKERGIQLEAWAPLTKGRMFDNAELLQLAEKYQKTPAQIILRWDLQNEVVTIPKSTTPSRIAENANIFDFELSDEDMEKISRFNRDSRIGRNPDDFV
ncbi:Aldo/keto reductase [Evansella caseinilytica]|uniref:Aldo/keto reductase n=1 Tax=Evansella caseinilytica TaxID=1503961 RepID=A0A1H3UYF3_9BACI|nr:aldo/keto reductase [Evansella caseinilytica]SDZ66839.1 Aldo/keto reductase [Evansella caseinilytica]